MNTKDVLCFSHLRWGFVFQRPQHLMSRFARTGRIFYWEEPVFEDTEAHLKTSVCPQTGVIVVTPVLPSGLKARDVIEAQKNLLSDLLEKEQLDNYVAWYYTPMAGEFTADLNPAVTVYDCMDELSAFAGAPPDIREKEQALFKKADLVFTGGASLFKSKQRQHKSTYLFPSSIDFAHFSKARSTETEPADQETIPHPRLGYSGVIDERMDLDLIKKLSEARPDWQLVILGPVAKISPGSLPQGKNIHYLGMKPYSDLPQYLSGWDVALLPFARNESTKFISPTKTPEYLAAGLPVVSSPIQDVVQPYGESGFVQIAEGPQEFIEKIEGLLLAASSEEHLRQIDKFLAQSSWDQTWSEMNRLIDISARGSTAVPSIPTEAIEEGSVYV